MTPLAIALAGVGALLVWSGFANPPGGVLGELGRVLRGEPTQGKIGNAPAAWTTTTPGAGVATATPAMYAAPDGASGKAAAILADVRAQLGKPYRWAAAGPDAFDCSGLVVYCYGRHGVHLPHSSAAQSLLGHKIASLSAAVPGDLLFYDRPVGHVAVYIGGGQMIAAPHTGDVVKIESATAPGPIVAIRRVIDAGSSGGGWV